MRHVVAPLSASAFPLAVAAATFTLAVGLPAGDPDMWWHLASGRWMVEHGVGMRVDVFSSTATGEPYALGQWLGEVVLYEAYALAGWTGVAVLRASLIALAAFAVTRLALRHAPAHVAIPLAAAAILLSKPTWTDRPQLFTLALFPVVLELCLAARAGSRAAVFAAVGVVAFWANTHGGYALGVAILWIFALEAVLERRPAIAQLAAAIAATVVVSAEPGALPLLRAVGHVAGSTVRIVEESPVDPLTPFGALFALFVGATLVVLMLRGGSLLGALVLVPVLVLALSAQRHVPLFGFAAVPFLAGPITAWAHEVGTTLKWGKQRGGRSRLALPLAGALWLGALVSVPTAAPGPDLRPYPVGAVDALAASGGILLNEYDWGGYLIWAVPTRPVFVDGRLYPFAGNGVIRQYQEAVHVLPPWRAVIERWNVAQVLLRPDRALVQALRDEGWAVRSQDEGFVLLERPR
ncbi:MAG: hypothetical protein HYS77_06960 [Candidatus Rokubacteria bacterium]|nr:hypothetical protein [Candidatus Rokubacteria bacterium]